LSCHLDISRFTLPLFCLISFLIGISITELVSKTHVESAIAKPKIEVMRSHYTPTIASQDSKCQLRILSPISSAGATEWYELVMEPNACLESEPHASGSYEHLTVLGGNLLVKSGIYEQSLNSGDTARYPADTKHQIQNTSEREARALLVYVLM
jgi:mannose-6-phosphate isomerase-like protein (cupin superfamily)